MATMTAHDDKSRDKSGEPEQNGPFRELVRRRRAELNKSLDQFAAAAVDPVSGESVKRGWIHRLETGQPVTPPEVRQLRALAAACELPLEQLQDAAGSQFHGVDPLISGSTEAKAYVHKLDRLPADQRERLLRLIDSLVPPEE